MKKLFGQPSKVNDEFIDSSKVRLQLLDEMYINYVVLEVGLRSLTKIFAL